MSGRFITFEGIDGSGKSTQINMLSSWLNEKDIPNIIVREPGGSSVSEKVRDILLDRKNLNLSFNAESFLFLSARAQLVNEIVIPALENGKYVICDRYIDSTIAYQGFGRGLDVEFLKKMNHFAINGIYPHLTFFLNITIDESILRRSSESDDRMESSGNSFLSSVNEGYLQLLKQESRIKNINASKDVVTVFQNICQFMTEKFEELS